MSGATALMTHLLVWLARLPLSGDREAAALLGVPEREAGHVLHDLALRGWIDSVEPESPELDGCSRYFVRDEAVAVLAARLDLSPAALAETLPIRRNDLLQRLARIEITAGVNRLCAELSSQIRSAGHAELADARSLPLAGRAATRWWLHGVDGYGCLRSVSSYAPFFVVWDRAAAPDVHRTRRVARWLREAASVRAQWGQSGLPPVLVVCSTRREIAVWRQAGESRTDRGSMCPLAMYFTTRRALREHGAGGPVWRSPAGDGGLLVEQIGWGPEPALPSHPSALFDGIDSLGSIDGQARGSIRRWAARRATVDSPRSRWQHAAALALATRTEEQALLEWLARHPLLAASDLSLLSGEACAPIERRLERLVRCRAAATAHTSITTRKEYDMDEEYEVRYVLTEAGMRFLASRAGVPPSTFGERGGITYATDDQREHPERAVRHVEHTLGVNRFMARLARDARTRGWMLAEWRNEAESACRFVDASGRGSWIRPDGAGVIAAGGERMPFLVEYDRGTLDAGDYRGKFEGYRRFYGDTASRTAFGCEPTLLFVCADDRAERRVLDAAGLLGLDIPLFSTAEWRYQAAPASSAPTLDAIWRRPTAADGRDGRQASPRSRWQPNLRDQLHGRNSQGGEQ